MLTKKFTKEEIAALSAEKLYAHLLYFFLSGCLTVEITNDADDSARIKLVYSETGEQRTVFFDEIDPLALTKHWHAPEEAVSFVINRLEEKHKGFVENPNLLDVVYRVLDEAHKREFYDYVYYDELENGDAYLDEAEDDLK